MIFCPYCGGNLSGRCRGECIVLACTFSSSTHLPKRIPFSRVLKKFLSVSLITSMPFREKLGSLPIFLMYRFA